MLAEYEDLPHAEIGRIADTSAKAVELRIYRARSDIANLHRDNIRLAERRIVYWRQKLARKDKGTATLVIGDSLLALPGSRCCELCG